MLSDPPDITIPPELQAIWGWFKAHWLTVLIGLGVCVLLIFLLGRKEVK